MNRDTARSLSHGKSRASPEPVGQALHSSHARVMRHNGKKPAVKWFYDTVPHNKDFTPGLAKTASRLLRSALSPQEGAASPGTCMEGLGIVKETLKKRRSERIKKAVAVAKARAEEAKAAAEAANTRAGQKRRAFRSKVGSRAAKSVRFHMDNALRRSDVA